MGVGSSRTLDGDCPTIWTKWCPPECWAISLGEKKGSKMLLIFYNIWIIYFNDYK